MRKTLPAVYSDYWLEEVIWKNIIQKDVATSRIRHTQSNWVVDEDEHIEVLKEIWNIIKMTKDFLYNQFCSLLGASYAISNSVYILRHSIGIFYSRAVKSNILCFFTMAAVISLPLVISFMAAIAKVKNHGGSWILPSLFPKIDLQLTFPLYYAFQILSLMPCFPSPLQSPYLDLSLTFRKCCFCFPLCSTCQMKSPKAWFCLCCDNI